MCRICYIGCGIFLQHKFIYMIYFFIEKRHGMLYNEINKY